jgi:hypothetical protein
LKKYLWTSLAFVAILLGSCGKDDPSGEIPVNPEKPNEVTKDVIVATFDNDDCKWSAGDKIAVLAKGISESFDLKEGENTSTAKFEGKLPADAIGVAFPFTKNNLPDISSDGILSMELSNIIEDVAKCNLPVWAELEGKNVKLKHLTGIFSVSLKGVPTGYNSLTLKASKVVSGSFKADLTQDEIILSPTENNTTDINKLLSVKFETATDADNNRDILLPLPVGMYDKIQVFIGKNGETGELLLDLENEDIALGQVCKTDIVYGNSDTPANVSETLKTCLNGADSSGSPVQVNLTNSIVADENPIVIPGATSGKTSYIILNFQKAPETSEEIPLRIEQNGEEGAGEVSNKLTLIMPEKANVENMLIKAPASTVTLMGGTYSKLMAGTATNTLIIGDNTVVENLIVTSGNVRIQSGGKITGSITNETGGDINIILDGVTKEDALPDGFMPSVDMQIVEGWEYDIRQCLNADGEYEIESIEELRAIAQAPRDFFMGKTVKLTKDIDFMGADWYSMGGFYGTFDGQGNTIKNAVIKSSDGIISDLYEDRIGFFGSIGTWDGEPEPACVKNLTFESCQIVDDGYYNSSILAERVCSGSSVINCHSKNCKITINKDYCMVGGLVGTLNGFMIACTSDTKLVSTVKEVWSMEIGGLVRHNNSKGIMVGCAYNGNITTGEFELLKDEEGKEGTFYVGGLACLQWGPMYGCYFGGTISGGQHVGALCGQLNNQAIFSDCYYDGSYNYVGNYFSITEENIKVGNLGYKDKGAVDALNSGIASYNQTAAIPCEYRFVKGDTPKLELTE